MNAAEQRCIILALKYSEILLFILWSWNGKQLLGKIKYSILLIYMIVAFMKNSMYIKTMQKVLVFIYKMELGPRLRPI